MKLYKRIVGAGLSALLAVGMALPALAAGHLEKDETVYVVMEPDGSVRSQTVSTHLHKEGGLAGAADRSTLTAIENTQDAAGFTQNGQELTWDTDKADVYYKGESTKTAPVTAEITYSLDGKTAPLEELLGQSGHLSITITLHNQETGTASIGGKEREICTPFVAMIGALLEEGYENIEAPHGVVKPLGNRQAAGFVCLPGVRGAIDDLLPGDLQDAESYLQDQATLEADVTDMTAPSIFIVCGADAEALETEGFSGLEGLDGLDSLQEDMAALDEGMAELLDGAQRLADGAQALNSGALELLSGVAQLAQGAAQLNAGAISLRNGAQELSAGAANARDGAQQLQSGANELAGGLSNLQAGAGALSEGYTQLKSGSQSLTAGLQALNGNSAALTGGMQQLTDGINALCAAAGPEGQLAAGSQAFAAALEGAAANAAGAVSQLPAPDSFAAMLAAAGVPAEQQGQLLAAYSGAYQSAAAMSGGLSELNSSYGQVAAGIQQAGAGAQALQAGAASLSQGLEAYTQGVASASAGANQLDSGLSQLGSKIPALTGGVAQLMDGSNRLSAGAGALSQGNAALAEGAQQLAQGSEALVSGTAQLVDGIAALLQGAQSLQSGTGELATGAGSLQQGLARYNSEGISKLTGSLDAEQLTSLKEALDAMESRLEGYGSFAGASEGAQVTTRFIMKTAEEPAAPVASEDAAAQPEEETFWQRVRGLFS